jgi:hypothetical protein
MTAPVSPPFPPTSLEHLRHIVKACRDTELPVGVLRILNELINRVEQLELEAKR